MYINKIFREFIIIYVRMICQDKHLLFVLFLNHL